MLKDYLIIAWLEMNHAWYVVLPVIATAIVVSAYKRRWVIMSLLALIFILTAQGALELARYGG